jgi:hypothetical protein
MNDAGIPLLIMCASFVPLLAVEIRSGGAGAQGGIIRRSECSVGYWIAILAQVSAGLSIIAIALAL